MPPARVFLIDDHAVFCSGLSMLLGAGIPNIEISAVASLDAAMRDAQPSVDVILLDINLKGLNGIEGIALLKRKWPFAHILMLSSQDDPKTVSRALTCGADGFISKVETAENIIASVNQILLGQPSSMSPDSKGREQLGLTPRQLEILNLLNQGLSSKHMANRLALSTNTINKHVQSVLNHFGVSSRAEAIFVARSRGLIN
jgi:DNA-binding NarL/FixJ family response regulator